MAEDLRNVQVELKQPRVIDVAPIDFVSGEPIDRKGTPTKRQLMTQSKMGTFAFTWFFSRVSDNSPWVLSAFQIAPAVLPISSSIVIRFP